MYNDLEEYLQLVITEGRKLAKRKKQPKHWCCPTCASCLAAEARGNVDDKKYGVGFSSREDICMMDAIPILAKELGFEIN